MVALWVLVGVVVFLVFVLLRVGAVDLVAPLDLWTLLFDLVGVVPLLLTLPRLLVLELLPLTAGRYIWSSLFLTPVFLVLVALTILVVLTALPVLRETSLGWGPNA